jgi:hypothetical protein
MPPTSRVLCSLGRVALGCFLLTAVPLAAAGCDLAGPELEHLRGRVVSDSDSAPLSGAHLEVGYYERTIACAVFGGCQFLTVAEAYTLADGSFDIAYASTRATHLMIGPPYDGRPYPPEFYYAVALPLASLPAEIRIAPIP